MGVPPRGRVEIWEPEALHGVTGIEISETALL